MVTSSKGASKGAQYGFSNAVTPEALAELTNSDLGRELLISYIHAEVEAEGIAAHEYDATDVERIRQMILRAETNFARNAALEKALHKAAIGDYETVVACFGSGIPLPRLQSDSCLLALNEARNNGNLDVQLRKRVRKWAQKISARKGRKGRHSFGAHAPNIRPWSCSGN